MSKRLNHIIYCLLVLLIIYQDSPLGLYAGAFGYSFMPIVSLLLAFVLIVQNKGKVSIPRCFMGMVKLFTYLIIISIVSIVIWGICGNSFTILNEDVVIKSIKVLLYFLSYIAFLFVVYNLSKTFTDKEFLSPIFHVFIIITVICVVEYFTKPYAFSFLHFTGGKYYGRIRLLAKESSWTSMTIFVYGLLSMYYALQVKVSRWRLILTLACLGLLIALSSSKTLFVVVFMSLIVALIINSRNMSRKSLWLSVGLVVIGICAYFMLSNKLTSAIEVSLQWSSIFTRTYTAAIGFVIGLFYPFGTGTALYLNIFPEFLKKYYYLLREYDTGYALAEINSFINATTDEAVTVKSGLLQYNMYWGIFGTVWFIRMFFKDFYFPFAKVRKKYGLIIKSGLIVALIMLLFSNDFTFEFWLLVSFAVFESKPQERNIKEI